MKSKIHASKRFATNIALFALVATLTTGAYANPNGDDITKAKTKTEALSVLASSEASAVDAATWAVFSKNLVHALQMDNDGVKMAAMQYIIRYNDKLDVDVAAVDVARLYRNHKDDNVRRMAAVALSKMQSPWAMGYLRLSAQYEKSETVRQTIKAIVAEHNTASDAPTAKIGA